MMIYNKRQELQNQKLVEDSLTKQNRQVYADDEANARKPLN